AQNATGNWIKIVQRVPVRIALDPKELTEHPLQVGLSMQVEVDTHDRSGERLPRVAPPPQDYTTTVFRTLEDKANERVKSISAVNANTTVAEARRPANDDRSGAVAGAEHGKPFVARAPST